MTGARLLSTEAVGAFAAGGHRKVADRVVIAAWLLLDRVAVRATGLARLRILPHPDVESQ